MRLLLITILLFTLKTVSAQHKENIYVIETELGNITLEVYPEKAPITVKNFKAYIARNNFEGASFYRVVRMDNQPKDSIKIEVIQGGFINYKNSLPSITHETTDKTGVLHKDGVISMARGKPGTASSAFFICVGNQPSLDFGGMRNPDGQGFAAFGKVIKGMKIVKKIQIKETNGQYLKKEIKINKIYTKE